MKRVNRQWALVGYDILTMAFVDLLLLVLYKSTDALSTKGVIQQAALTFVCVFAARLVGKVYLQVWRYGGIQCYIRLLVTDGAAFIVNYVLSRFLPFEEVTFARLLSIVSLNLLGGLALRMFYRYAYKCGDNRTRKGRFLGMMLRIFSGSDIVPEHTNGLAKTRIAIVGAGRVGVTLAEELLGNPAATALPRCFLDNNEEKIGREIHGLPILPEDGDAAQRLKDHEVQEVVIAIPNLSDEKKKEMFNFYFNMGYKVRVYDFPVMQSMGKKRHMRDFNVEELLFRKQITVAEEVTVTYYRNKVIMITGGGGSIGSELCRQIAGMQPKKLIVLDVYENGAYDIQQELKIQYGDSLNLAVEIISVTDRNELENVFNRHHPDVVIHAAAHKHVPLMENNCCEAVKNNVFGTKTLVETAEAAGCRKFIMVSTDKAVNPTNVMGATKRMCELIVLNHKGNMECSATRFGNVLGSNGSVIPLFKRQIANGGPITLTDRRIIRYFMTIPEASQLVLTSGAIAKHGELFVLDMGKPIHILELAENMIRLSGFEPYKDIDIVETGLRPGEKLFEELLVRSEQLDKTSNDQIFVERDKPLDPAVVAEKLAILRKAVESNSNDACRDALHQVVETYHTPEEVNRNAEKSREMASVSG